MSVGARPTQQPTPAFQWENSCSPSQLTIYFKLYQSKPTRFILIFMILYIIYFTLKVACPPSSQTVLNYINQNQLDGSLYLCFYTMYLYSHLYSYFHFHILLTLSALNLSQIILIKSNRGCFIYGQYFCQLIQQMKFPTLSYKYSPGKFKSKTHNISSSLHRVHGHGYDLNHNHGHSLQLISVIDVYKW